MGREPFSNVYFTGIVRDKIGRKMSKTLGNSPDPLDLIDKYGADSVRIGMLLCSSAGNDIFYDESMVEQGRNFCNKIWNSYRLIKSWKTDVSKAQPDASAMAVRWFRDNLSRSVETVEDHYSKFRISDALMTTYRLFWDDFCSWYLEIVKPAYGEAMDQGTYESTLGFFDSLLRMIHPIMPFITEELWQNMAERKEGETIMYAATPVSSGYDPALTDGFAVAAETVNGIRNVRNQKNIPPKEKLNIEIKGAFPTEMVGIVRKMAGVDKVDFVSGETKTSGVTFLVRTTEITVPLAGLVNAAEEIAKLEKDLEYQQRFLDGVRKKLSNEAFTSHAPEAVVANERKKESDALSRIEMIKNQLESLKNS